MLEIGVGRVPSRAEAIALPVRPADDDEEGAVGPAGGLALVARRRSWRPRWGATSPIWTSAGCRRHGQPAAPTRTLARPRGTASASAPETSAAWRAAGAALSRTAASRFATLTVPLPVDDAPAAVGPFAEAAWLASYRYRLTPEPADRAPVLRRITLSDAAPDAEPRSRRPPVRPRRRGGPAAAVTAVTAAPTAVDAALERAGVIAEMVFLARDLVNTPSLQKSPRWFADRIAGAAARRPG